MDDTIFKPLTHLDRQGADASDNRFTSRDNPNFHDDYFQNAGTNPTHPEKGWGENDQQETTGPSADNDCGCISDAGDDLVVVETIIVEYTDDTE